MHAYVPKSSCHNNNSPVIHKKIIIRNELKLNELETMAEESGMLSEFKDEDYDSG